MSHRSDGAHFVIVKFAMPVMNETGQSFPLHRAKDLLELIDSDGIPGVRMRSCLDIRHNRAQIAHVGMDLSNLVREGYLKVRRRKRLIEIGKIPNVGQLNPQESIQKVETEGLR